MKIVTIQFSCDYENDHGIICGEESAPEPLPVKAKRSAKLDGWFVSRKGGALCPMHNTLSTRVHLRSIERAEATSE